MSFLKLLFENVSSFGELLFLITELIRFDFPQLLEATLKKMFELIGHPTVRTIRTEIGPLQLGRLPVGTYRFLAKSEIEAVKKVMESGQWFRHAVVDRELDTLHVFTGLEISAIPKGRARVLRAVAG